MDSRPINFLISYTLWKFEPSWKVLREMAVEVAGASGF